MYNICIRSLNSSESCKTFFFVFKTRRFSSKNVRPIAGPRVTQNDSKKCRFFEFQKYEGKRKTFVYDKRLIFTRIKNHFRSLASYESLALKQRFGATREWPINNMAANKLSTTPQSSSKSSFASPYLFCSQTSLNAKNTKQVFGTFFEGKRNFWTAKIQEIKVQNCLLNISKDQNQFKKISCRILFNPMWKDGSCISGLFRCRIFMCMTNWRPICQAATISSVVLYLYR